MKTAPCTVGFGPFSGIVPAGEDVSRLAQQGRPRKTRAATLAKPIYLRTHADQRSHSMTANSFSRILRDMLFRSFAGYNKVDCMKMPLAIAPLCGALFLTQAGSAADFSGTWQSCGSNSGKRQCTVQTVIHQQGGKACGFWYYWATSREYEGRFAGVVSGKRLDWKSVCGTPGSTAPHYCPEPSENAEFFKSLGAETKWAASSFHSLLCNGKLYEFENGQGSTSCSNLSAPQLEFGLTKSTAGGRKPALGATSEDQQWLRACLQEK